MSRGVTILELATELARKHARGPSEKTTVIQVLVDDLEAAMPALSALCEVEGGRLLRSTDLDLQAPVPATSNPLRRASVVAGLSPQPGSTRHVDLLELGDGRIDAELADPPAVVPSPGEQAVLAIARAVLHRDLDDHVLVVIAYSEHVIDLPFRRALWALAADQLSGMPHDTLRTLVFVVETAINVGLHCQTGRGFQLAIDGERLLYRKGADDLRSVAGQIARYSKPFVIFLGAGFSASSRLPLGNAMRNDAIRRLLNLAEDEIVPTLELAERFHSWISERDWLFASERQMPQAEFTNSLTLERVIRAEQRVEPSLPTLRQFREQHDRVVGSPGAAVVHLASILERAVGRIIVVELNFDLLIETHSPVPLRIFASEQDFADARDYIQRYIVGDEQALPLIKLHGTISDFESCIVSSEQTELGIGQAKYESLRVLLDSDSPRLWIYVGASLRDLDLRPVLQHEEFARGLDERFVLPYLPESVEEFGNAREPTWRQRVGLRSINDRLVTETADAFMAALRAAWPTQV